MKTTIGFLVSSRHLGEYIVPTAAEHEAELADRGVDVIPFATVEALSRIGNVFPGARVVSLKLKGRRR